MPSDMRAFVGAALVFLAAATSAAAQASPYLPLDDPRLPLLEHLIARGDVEDPSPMIRPFRIGDAVPDANGNQITPMFLIGTVERTYRIALASRAGRDRSTSPPTAGSTTS